MQLAELTERSLSKIARLEAFVSRSPFGRVVHEEEIEEPQSGWAQIGELVFQVVIRLCLERKILQSRQRFHFGPYGRMRRAQQLYDHVQLLHLSSAGQQWLVQVQFTQDASGRPNIDGRRVRRRVKKKFGGSVPKSHNSWRHGLNRFAETSRQAEISNLDATSIRHKKVRYFEIAVNVIVLVKICQALE